MTRSKTAPNKSKNKRKAAAKAAAKTRWNKYNNDQMPENTFDITVDKNHMCEIIENESEDYDFDLRKTNNDNLRDILHNTNPQKIDIEEVDEKSTNAQNNLNQLNLLTRTGRKKNYKRSYKDCFHSDQLSNDDIQQTDSEEDSLLNLKSKKKNKRDQDEEYKLEDDIDYEDKLTGARIIDLKQLSDFLMSYADHCIKCTSTPQYFDEWHCGLHSIIMLKCYKCGEVLNFHTYPSQSNARQGYYDLNLLSVLSSLSTGLGYSAMNEIFSIHNIRYMNRQQYNKCQNSLSVTVNQELNDSLVKNLEIEKKIAADELNFNGGYPAISCIGDARWSKRSYNYNYTANSSTAVLIGMNTKKILYTGVKNKYCSICQNAINKETKAQHICYKNWNGPSTSMEAALIVEGFAELENKGARVMQYIGDQDSSVMNRIIRKFEWGEHVLKVDCINHKIKNFTTFLINWRKKNRLVGRFTETMINHYKALLRKLINEKIKDVDYFTKHLLYTLDHLTGHHEKCDTFYCDENHKFKELIITKEAYNEVQEYLKKFLKRVNKLEQGVTSNLAEAFFSVVNKFDHGKIKNLIQRGNYELRSFCAALCFNEGPQWNYEIIKNTIKIDSQILRNFFLNKEKKYTSNRKRKLSLEYKESRIRTKYKRAEENTQNDYGPNANVEHDPVDIWENCKKYYNENIVTDNDMIDNIEVNTQDQAESQSWFKHRVRRLTSSKFGDICKATSDKRRINLTKELIYSTGGRFISKPLQYGIENESIARDAYADHTETEVSKSGLRISHQFPFLGCSPDGIITYCDNNNTESKKLLEIKCPYAHRSSSLEEMKSEKSFYMQYNEETDDFTLKKQNQYYYQVQGALNISQIDDCDFVVYTPENDLIIDTIEINGTFWNENMLPKLKAFYFQFYLPELVLGCHEQKQDIFIFDDQFYQDIIVPSLLSSVGTNGNLY